MATVEEIERLFQENLGRGVDPNNLPTWHDLPANEVEQMIKGSQEYLIRDFYSRDENRSTTRQEMQEQTGILPAAFIDVKTGETVAGLDANEIEQYYGDGASTSYALPDWYREVGYGQEMDHNITFAEAQAMRKHAGADSIISDEILQGWVEEGTDQPFKYAQFIIGYMNEKADEAKAKGESAAADFYYDPVTGRQSREKVEGYRPVNEFTRQANVFSAKARSYKSGVSKASAVGKYDAWREGGGSLGEEFSASERGQYVAVDPGQAMADEYQQVGKTPDGRLLYVDSGVGGGGVLGGLGDAIGVDITGAIDSWVPNELVAATTPRTVQRLVGGESMQEQGEQGFRTAGVNDYNEWGDAAEKAVVTAAAVVLSPFTAGQSLWLIPAHTALQGTSMKVGGTARQQDATEWSTVAENTAWDAATAYVGGAGGLGTAARISASVAIAATRAKTRGGGTWGDAGYAAASSYIGNSGMNAGAAATLNAGLTYARTGDLAASAVSGAVQYAGSRFGGGGGWRGGLITSATNLATGLIESSAIDDPDQRRSARINAFASAAKGFVLGSMVKADYGEAPGSWGEYLDRNTEARENSSGAWGILAGKSQRDSFTDRDKLGWKVPGVYAPTGFDSAGNPDRWGGGQFGESFVNTAGESRVRRPGSTTSFPNNNQAHPNRSLVMGEWGSLGGRDSVNTGGVKAPRLSYARTPRASFTPGGLTLQSGQTGIINRNKR